MKQGTISFVVAPKVPKASSVKKVTAPATAVPTATHKPTSTLVSTDPRVQAFYDQLTPAEVIAHTIAVEKLGTSYDVTRTHGFVKWSKANPPA